MCDACIHVYQPDHYKERLFPHLWFFSRPLNSCNLLHIAHCPDPSDIELYYSMLLTVLDGPAGNDQDYSAVYTNGAGAPGVICCRIYDEDYRYHQGMMRD